MRLGNPGGRVRPKGNGAHRAARVSALLPEGPSPQVRTRRPRAALALFLAVTCAGCAAGAVAAPPSPVAPLPASLAYDDARVIGCHNCFERRHAPTIEAALDGAHAIEIDVVDAWAPRRATGAGPERAPRTWFVAHAPRETRHLSNCGDAPRQTLRDCLLRIRGWVDAHPDAGVRTIYLDVRSPWSAPPAGRTPDDLDALLRETLGDARLLSPADLLEKADTSPRRAMRRRGWPTMGAMRRHGAVLVVLTDATEGRDGALLSAYAGRLRDAAGWVAPSVSLARQVPAWEGDGVRSLPGFDGKVSEWVLFLNHRLTLRPARRADPSTEVGPEARKAGLVTRVWAKDERALEQRVCALADAGFNVFALERFGRFGEALAGCGGEGDDEAGDDGGGGPHPGS